LEKISGHAKHPKGIFVLAVFCASLETSKKFYGGAMTYLEPVLRVDSQEDFIDVINKQT